jgi:hypothetical protein
MCERASYISSHFSQPSSSFIGPLRLSVFQLKACLPHLSHTRTVELGNAIRLMVNRDPLPLKPEVNLLTDLSTAIQPLPSARLFPLHVLILRK